MDVDPQTSILELKGVGPRLQDTLAKLGIYRFVDMLLHLPYRYQDRTRITPIGHAQAGHEYLIEGRIENVSVQFGKRRSLKVLVRDDSGQASLRFFHFSKFQRNKLENSGFIRAYGELRFFGRDLTMAHPEYETYDSPPPPPDAELTPIYPSTQGLGQARLRSLAANICAQAWPEVAGTPFAKLQFLHQPPAGATLEQIAELQQEVALDEMTAYFLVMKGRALKRQQERGIPLAQSHGLGRKLVDHLGFHLTQAQARVAGEVLKDLERPLPMLRLVQGDVGSGKTIIAAFAAIRAAEHGAQTALMAPTELLAEQHYLNFHSWLTPLGLKTTLLTGQLPAKQQRERLADVAGGASAVVIGTHALFQESVVFNNLALAIIDEQHRFGVHQRMALQHKVADSTKQPHQLIMTATPIPRTLTMALYADMDVSVIDELPKGRQPITTHTADAGRRPQVVEQIHKALSGGQQAYWVCTLIEDSDEIDATSATTMHGELSAALPEHKVALLHGRMKSDEKAALMAAFKRGEIHMLVATTVVEVGVDVPNATYMVIEDADRLGLAQLHQLRGRVGRGDQASQCFLLFTQEGLSETAKRRLQTMRESQDGFYLAEQDLKIRGPGDLLGTRQSGEQSFRIADLGVHAHLMPQVIRRGEALLRAKPGSKEAEEMANLLQAWAPPDSGHLSA